jgi:hypothetical protein
MARIAKASALALFSIALAAGAYRVVAPVQSSPATVGAGVFFPNSLPGLKDILTSDKWDAH